MELRRTPSGESSMVRDVAVPAFNTLLSTVFIGIPIGYFVYFILTELGIEIHFLTAAAGIGSIVMVVAWLITSRMAMERSHIIEEIHYMEDAPHHPPPQTIRIEEETQTRYGPALKRFDIDLPSGIDEKSFFDFCQTVIETEDFSETTWCGANGKFSRPAYGKLRHQLMQLAILEWKDQNNHAQGVKLTARGRRVFSRLIDIPPTQTSHTGINRRER